jgi:hypothetical protein
MIILILMLKKLQIMKKKLILLNNTTSDIKFAWILKILFFIKKKYLKLNI